MRLTHISNKAAKLLSHTTDENPATEGIANLIEKNERTLRTGNLSAWEARKLESQPLRAMNEKNRKRYDGQ